MPDRQVDGQAATIELPPTGGVQTSAVGSGHDAAEGLWSVLPTADPRSILQLIETGGPVVAILLLLSLAAMTVIILKVVQFGWIGVGSTSRSERALRAWIAGRPDEAAKAVAGGRAPSQVALLHGIRSLRHGVEERIVREDVERVALEQLAGLRAHMRILEATVQIAPLLGLFGTVLGMIDAFRALQSAGAEADPAVLAGGIWVALMTTAVGLAIAIPVAFLNTWLEGLIDRERQITEAALTSLFTRRAMAGAGQMATGDTQVRVMPAAE